MLAEIYPLPNDNYTCALTTTTPVQGEGATKRSSLPLRISSGGFEVRCTDAQVGVGAWIVRSEWPRVDPLAIMTAEGTISA